MNIRIKDELYDAIKDLIIKEGFGESVDLIAEQFIRIGMLEYFKSVDSGSPKNLLLKLDLMELMVKMLRDDLEVIL